MKISGVLGGSLAFLCQSVICWCVWSLFWKVPGQNQRCTLCELPTSPALRRPILGNSLSCNPRTAGFLWVPLFVWHQEIGMPMRYSHWKFNHTWTTEFRYWRSYPHLMLYSKKVFILCGEKVKGQNSNTSEKHPKGQQERKTQHHIKVKKWGSSSSVIWEVFLPCWTAYILSFPLQWRNRAINLWRMRQGGRSLTLPLWFPEYCISTYGYHLLMF